MNRATLRTAAHEYIRSAHVAGRTHTDCFVAGAEHLAAEINKALEKESEDIFNQRQESQDQRHHSWIDGKEQIVKQIIEIIK